MLAQAAQQSHVAQLHVLPANADLAGAEVELVGRPRREFVLADVLNSGETGGYGQILIDCPPSLRLLTIKALTAAVQVLVVVQAEDYALAGLSELQNTVE